MDLLKRIAEFNRIERNVFFEELEESGHEMDFVRYAAAQAQDVFNAFLEALDPYSRRELQEEAERIRPVSDGDAKKAGKEISHILSRMDELMEKQERLHTANMGQIQTNRDFMKEWLTRQKAVSDQSKGLPCPPVQRAPAPEATIIKLPDAKPETLIHNDLFAAIRDRQSHRKFTPASLSIDELSFLLWSTQGIKKILGNGVATLRTVPSGGARHPFETYLAINHVNDLTPGMYHYLPVEHALELMFQDPEMATKMKECGVGQRFVGECAVCFIWSCIPYRGEWRYTIASHKVMLLDAGHVCQNLYLACEAIGCGTCAVGAYHQTLADTYLGLDGQDEFVVYMSPVGRPG